MQIETRNLDRVTHEFFGIGLVVNEAQEAKDIALRNPKAALGSK